LLISETGALGLEEKFTGARLPRVLAQPTLDFNYVLDLIEEPLVDA
jgi:hypothetical protein